ncbi:MAG: MocE family 2Fe-2S type ferredoxin [Paracoccaceae bacterium]|jgi:3-phenylpropionate/trans-cinnamate dioxygenase ferredoxin component|nr:MocE family 2Fe-2S type ferredoxin [Paracoccaceae bacterium]
MPWVDACSIDDIESEDLIRFDYCDKTYAIYCSPTGDFFCTDGLCTHESIHLEDGLVIDYEIECPMHNATFDYRTGEALRAPACVDLKIYKTEVRDNRVWIEVY